jgi:nucleoside 2-deoxyribosyltransferase
MWEVGYAMALAKPTLLISQDRAGLPFDLKDMHTVFYIRDALAETLRKPLA